MSKNEKSRAEMIMRLNAILRKAESTTSQSEAENAMALMNRLLIKHNISRDELRDPEPQYKQVLVKLNKPYTQWQRMLGFVLAKANLCECYNHGKSEIFIVGETTNLDVTVQMFLSLRNQLEVISDVEFKMAKAFRGIRDNAASWKYAFFMSAVYVLQERFKKEREDVIKEDEQENQSVGEQSQEGGAGGEEQAKLPTRALAVIDSKQKELNQYIRDNFGETTTPKKRKARKWSTDGEAKGTEVGEEVNPLEGLNHGN